MAGSQGKGGVAVAEPAGGPIFVAAAQGRGGSVLGEPIVDHLSAPSGLSPLPLVTPMPPHRTRVNANRVTVH